MVASFPSEDHAFARFIGSVMSRVHPTGPEQLMAALRKTHPYADVRPRDLSGESLRIWYVYRDGAALARWATGMWWESPGVARVRLDGQGRFVEADEAAHEIAGVEPGALIGGSFRDIALPDDAEGVELMWRALADFGRLDSVYTVTGRDGHPVTVEVHAEVTADGAVTWSRPILLVTS